MPWLLRIYGEVALSDPQGVRVELPHRKVAELLALLALHLRDGISREALCAAIWPDAPLDRSRASLRQSLAQLRKAIGSHNVLASRSLCALAEDFQIVTDIEDSTLRNATRPSHVLDQGFARACEQDLQDLKVETAGDQFFKFVKSAALYDPDRALATMRDNIPMCHGLPAGQLSELLNTLPQVTKYPGWKAYFRAIVLNETSQISASYGYLQEAHMEAIRTNDIPLAIQTTSLMCLSRILAGELDMAKQWAIECRVLAKKVTNPNLRATAAQTTGTFLVHRGDFKEGIEWYRRAEDMYTHLLDTHAIRAQRHYCEQSFLGGQVPLDELESTLKFGRQSGHVLLNWFTEAALANRSLYDSHPVDALTELHRSMSLAKATQNNIVLVFSMDSLTRGFLRAKMKGEAREVLTRSKRVRDSISMRFSIWDNLRDSVQGILA